MLAAIAVWNGRVALFGKEAAHCDVGDRIDGLPEYSAADVAAHGRAVAGSRWTPALKLSAVVCQGPE